MYFLYLLVDSNLDSPSVIHKVIYDEGSRVVDYEAPERTIYTDTIKVAPEQKYWIKFEVLQSDLGDSDEKVSEIEINGQRFGECNPNGGDHDCTFFNCAPQLLSNEIVSENGRLQLKITYQGHSRDCDCDKHTWRCKKEDTEKSLTPMTAAARITLTPMSKKLKLKI